MRIPCRTCDCGGDLFGLGIRLIAKAIKNEWVNERREESLDVKSS